MIIQKPVSRELWQELALRCPWATYVHTPAWAEAVAHALPGFRVEGIGFFDEGQPPVVLPAVARPKKRLLRMVRDYKSMEPGVYGGFIAEQPLQPQQISGLCAALRSLKKSSIRIVETPDMPLNLPAPFVAKAMATHRIALGRPYAEVAAAFSRGQKSNLSQARRKGVRVRVAAGEEDVRQYYELYRRTLERWESARGSVYPLEFFLHLYRQRDTGVQVWLAEADGVVAAGIVVLAWRRTLLYWHGSARQDYFKLYPNNLLHATVLEWACDRDFVYYDMGPSMGLDGVVRFKESFGARQVPFAAYRWKS